MFKRPLKLVLLTLSLVILTFDTYAYSSSSMYTSVPVELDIPVDGIYSPRGYDSLDSSELVISGYLPNTCHKNPKVEIKRMSNIFLIKVTSLYYEQSNPYCAEVLIPFLKTVNLGVLKNGTYLMKLVQGNSVEKVVEYKVREARLGENKNEIFANVEHVEKIAGTDTIILRGHNPSDCFKLDKIKVIDNNRKTISIHPRMVKIRSFCPQKMVPFKYEVKVPSNDTEERSIIHIRTMYGDSLNLIH